MEWAAKKENASFPVCFTALKCTSNIPSSRYAEENGILVTWGRYHVWPERSLVSWWCGLNDKWPTGSHVWTLGSHLVLSGEVAWLLECRALLDEVHHWDIVLRVHSLILFFAGPFCFLCANKMWSTKFLLWPSAVIPSPLLRTLPMELSAQINSSMTCFWSWFCISTIQNN